MNRWFRFYSEFAHDPKVQMLSETDQRRYIMLLCLRCSNGDVTLHETEVAFQLRITEEEWAKTKAVLLSKKLICKDNKPTAWEKRQYASDSSAGRVSKHREKKKQECNVTGNAEETKCNALDTDTDTDRESKDSLVPSDAGDALPSIPQCPQQAIIAAYAEALPELSQPRVWDASRQTNLRSRWRWVLADLKRKGKPCTADDGLDYFRRFFGYVSRSDFLMGRSEKKWHGCDLAWLSKAENFAKVLEGKYHVEEAAA